MPNSDQPIATPYAQRAADFRRRTLPLLVWGVAAIACVFLIYGKTRQFEYIGIAQALDYEISAGATGRLETVVVALFDDIEAGEVVATLDDEALRASIETARSSIRQLGAELEATRLRASADGAGLVAELRRFQIDEERRKLQVLSLRVVIESDEIERERLDLEVKRNLPLRDAGFLSDSDYDNFRLERDRVATRIEKNRRLLAQTEAEFATTRSRRQQFEDRLPDLPEAEPLLQPLRAAVEVEAQRLNEIEVQRRSLVLRSPITGRVSQLLCRAGQSVVPGEPILTVTEAAPREIVAWLGENAGELPKGDRRVLVTSQNRPGKVAESVILRISPSIRALPDRLWPNPRIPVYGRAVVIAGVPALDLMPGERVTIRLAGR